MERPETDVDGPAHEPAAEPPSGSPESNETGADSDGQSAADGLLGGVTAASLRRGAGIFGLVLLVLVVLPFVLYAVPGLVGAEHSYVVLSPSMEPALSPGDVTLVDAVDPAAVSEGDVITFERQGDRMTTTHRVVEVVQQGGERAFRTMGDANEAPDPSLVGPDQVVGRVMTVGGHLLAIPLAGYVIQFTNTDLGFALLFVVPLSLLVVSELWNVLTTARGSDADGEPADTQPSDETPRSTGRETAVTESDPAAVDSSPGDDPDPWLTLSTDELRLGAIVAGLGLFYCLWVAVQVRTAWSVGAATSAFVAVVLLGGLSYFSDHERGMADQREVAAPVAASPPDARETVAGSGDSLRIQFLDPVVIARLSLATAEPIRPLTATGLQSLRLGETLYLAANDRPTERVDDVGSWGIDWSVTPEGTGTDSAREEVPTHE